MNLAMFCLILLAVPPCFNILGIILAHDDSKVFKYSSIPANSKNFSFKGSVKFFLRAYYQQICNPHDGYWKGVSLIIKSYGDFFCLQLFKSRSKRDVLLSELF